MYAPCYLVELGVSLCIGREKREEMPAQVSVASQHLLLHLRHCLERSIGRLTQLFPSLGRHQRPVEARAPEEQGAQMQTPDHSCAPLFRLQGQFARMLPQEQPAPAGHMCPGTEAEHATERHHGYVARPIGKGEHWHLIVKVGQYHRSLLDDVYCFFHHAFLRLSASRVHAFDVSIRSRSS